MTNYFQWGQRLWFSLKVNYSHVALLLLSQLRSTQCFCHSFSFWISTETKEFGDRKGSASWFEQEFCRPEKLFRWIFSSMADNLKALPLFHVHKRCNSCCEEKRTTQKIHSQSSDRFNSPAEIWDKKLWAQFFSDFVLAIWMKEDLKVFVIDWPVKRPLI